MTIVELQPTARSIPDRPDHPPVLDLVIPVHGAMAGLEITVRQLHRSLSASFPLPWRITIVDAASTDGSWPTACRLARSLPTLRALRLTDRGEGQAVFAAWERSDAAVLARIDPSVPLELNTVLPLVAPLLSGHSDLAVTGRSAGGHAAAGDAALAIRRDRLGTVRLRLAGPGDPTTADILAAATSVGLRVHQVPVGADRVPNGRRPRRGCRPGGQLGRQAMLFTSIGVLSTLAYLAVFVALRGNLGPFAANTIALGLTALANTAANRRLTFGVSDRAGLVRHQLQGLLVFALALGITTGSLALLHAVTASPGRGVEVATLLAANLAATALRFVLMRSWVFRGSSCPAPAPG